MPVPNAGLLPTQMWGQPPAPMPGQMSALMAAQMSPQIGGNMPAQFAAQASAQMAGQQPLPRMGYAPVPMTGQALAQMAGAEPRIGFVLDAQRVVRAASTATCAFEVTMVPPAGASMEVLAAPMVPLTTSAPPRVVSDMVPSTAATRLVLQ